jgi:hypothetical protein
MENLMVRSVYFSSDLMDGQDLFTPLGNRIKINVNQGMYESWNKIFQALTGWITFEIWKTVLTDNTIQKNWLDKIDK